MNWLLNWHWWRTRARWIDRFAPVPSVMLALPILLVVAWDAVQTLQMGFWIDECGAYWLSQHLSSLLRPPFGFSNFGLPYAAVLSLFAWAEPPWFETVARLPSLDRKSTRLNSSHG